MAAFSSFDFTSLLYTGLLRWNADMKVEPDLAVEDEQPNDTTYVFSLRSGVKFHNGQDPGCRRRGSDLRPHAEFGFGEPNATVFSTISSVTVVDPLTVRFELKAPNAAFPSFLATNPMNCITPRGVSDLNTKPVGTGPLMFQSTSRTSSSP